MKIFSLLALFLSTQAFAGTFRADSAVPTELQAKIEAAVRARCLGGLYGLQEEQTVVTEKRVDQDRDLYFRTFLKASYLFDGTHPVGADLVVESAAYAISNPSVEKYEVLSVRSFSQGVCQ